MLSTKVWTPWGDWPEWADIRAGNWLQFIGSDSQDWASGELEFGGPSFAFRKVRDLSDRVESLPREELDWSAKPYRQCAVAILGTKVRLPEQIRDILVVITLAPPGERNLERYEVVLEIRTGD